MPRAPLPAYKSSTWLKSCSIESRIEKTTPRMRSEVGRVSLPRGARNVRPRLTRYHPHERNASAAGCWGDNGSSIDWRCRGRSCSGGRRNQSAAAGSGRRSANRSGSGPKRYLRAANDPDIAISDNQ